MSEDQLIQQKGSFDPFRKSSIPAFLHMRIVDLVPTNSLGCASVRGHRDLNHQPKLGGGATTSACLLRRDPTLYAPGKPVLARPTSVVVSARKADGARPRQKPQRRMWSDTNEKEHELLDHRARSAPERRNLRKRNADLLIEASRPRNSHSYGLRRSKTRTSPIPENGHDGTGAQRATVLEQGPLVGPATDQITLFHCKRYLAHISMGQPGLVSPS